MADFSKWLRLLWPVAFIDVLVHCVKSDSVRSAFVQMGLTRIVVLLQFGCIFFVAAETFVLLRKGKPALNSNSFLTESQHSTVTAY